MAHLAPKTTPKWSPKRSRSDQGRPSRNMRRRGRIACPPPLGSSVFAPFPRQEKGHQKVDRKKGTNRARTEPTDPERSQRSQNGARTQPERSQNGARTEPERSQNRARTPPERSQRSQNGARTEPERSQNATRTEPERSQNAPRTVPERSQNGARTVPERSQRRPLDVARERPTTAAASTTSTWALAGRE